jgi:hypothetical protein
MYAAPEIIGTCLTCIAPASLGATFALILLGLIFAVYAERRKMAPAKTRRIPTSK